MFIPQFLHSIPVPTPLPSIVGFLIIQLFAVLGCSASVDLPICIADMLDPSLIDSVAFLSKITSLLSSIINKGLEIIYFPSGIKTLLYFDIHDCKIYQSYSSSNVASGNNFCTSSNVIEELTDFIVLAFPSP